MNRIEEVLISGNVEIASDMIQNMVYNIRGQQVMLDSDLAMLYQVETKRLNEAVKRNIDRFPERYRFQLTKDEDDNLKSQFATSSSTQEQKADHGGRRKLPYVFTEQGISMLSAVLRSDVAVKVSLRIMDTFVEMRKFFSDNSLLFERISTIELKQLEYRKQSDEKFEQLFNYMSEHEQSQQKIFFDGQIYDAFSLLIDLVKSAEKSILLIDNYVDMNTLNILAKKKENINVHVYTLENTFLSKTDVKIFNKQYPRLIVEYVGNFHDRFLILDNERVYHIGASLKDAGKKCFAISLMEDTNIANSILHYLKLKMNT